MLEQWNRRQRIGLALFLLGAAGLLVAVLVGMGEAPFLLPVVAFLSLVGGVLMRFG